MVMNKKVIENETLPFKPNWDVRDYSIAVCIAEDYKREAAHRHSPLIFSLCQSLIKVKTNIPVDVYDRIEDIDFAHKTLLIDDYAIFIDSPDFLLKNQTLGLISTNFFFKYCMIRLKDGPFRFIYDEGICKSYEKVAGIEVCDKIFSKTQKTRFNNVAIDGRFCYNNEVYIKCPLILSGCCSPQFNAIDSTDSEKLIYLNGNVEVERVIE